MKRYTNVVFIIHSLFCFYYRSEYDVQWNKGGMFYSLVAACVLLYILKWGGLFCCLFLFIIIVIACHDDQLTKYAEGNVSSNSECKLLTHVHQMLCFCVQYVNKSIQEKYIQQVFDAILSSPEIENIQPRLGQWFFLHLWKNSFKIHECSIYLFTKLLCIWCPWGLK